MYYFKSVARVLSLSLLISGSIFASDTSRFTVPKSNVARAIAALSVAVFGWSMYKLKQRCLQPLEDYLDQAQAKLSVPVAFSEIDSLDERWPSDAGWKKDILARQQALKKEWSDGLAQAKKTALSDSVKKPNGAVDCAATKQKFDRQAAVFARSLVDKYQQEFLGVYRQSLVDLLKDNNQFGALHDIQAERFGLRFDRQLKGVYVNGVISVEKLDNLRDYIVNEAGQVDISQHSLCPAGEEDEEETEESLKTSAAHNPAVVESFTRSRTVKVPAREVRINTNSSAQKSPVTLSSPQDDGPLFFSSSSADNVTQKEHSGFVV